MSAPRPGVRVVDAGRAHQRLQQLCEISKVLARFESVERSVPQAIGIVARTLPARSAVLVIETAGSPRTIVWHAEGEDVEQLRSTKDHAQQVYRYLVPSRTDLEATESLPLGLLRASAVGQPRSERKSFIVLPLVVERGTIFGALQIEAAAPFDELDLVLANAFVNQLAVAVDRHAVMLARQTASEAEEKEQRLLAQLGTIISDSADPRSILAAVARCVVPLFADVCIVDEMSEAGAFCRLEVVVADPRKHPEIADRMMRLAPCPERETPQAKVLESSRPVLCAEIGDPVMRAAGLRSMIVVPLRARDRNIGALTFVAADSRRRYEQHDLSLAEDFARRVATAVDNAWLYQQARYATRARDDLLAMVSHDLGNPLAAILICLAAIRRETATGGDRRRSRAHLEGIERSAHDMKSLIADLLDNATIDAGQLRIARARLGTTQLVSDAVAAVRPLARARSVLVRSQLSPGLPAISGDAARLRRVLTNLLDNAVKFSSEGGTITVEARALDGAVTFSVADTGPGIATEDVPRLFDRFWRAEHTQRTGTGLGLYIAKGVIDAHGGTIWAESKIGEGSKFCFTLPVESPDPQLPRVRHGSNNVVATRELVDGVTCDASPA